MPNTKPENPLAFPCVLAREQMDDSAPHGFRTVRDDIPGMTLRDYFAAQALATAHAIWRQDPRGSELEAVSMLAYHFADAMLAERAK